MLELAKFGFIAVAAKKLFGTDKPTQEQRDEIRDLIGDIEAEAPAIHRDGDRFLTVRGYRRIEPKRFPKPRADRFTEVLSRNPTRDVHDLRKNAYEIGGIIRGNRLLYYRGDEGSVQIIPIINTAGGLVEGDVLFHTHPGSSYGGLSTSIPSVADLRVHIWAATILGNEARHIISGSDGLRELRVEIDDQAKWNRRTEELAFWIWLILMDEMFRGVVWWETYGIRRALRRLEELDLGGRLVVSEPTTPGSEFVPLAPYVAPTRVSPPVLAELQRLDVYTLRDLYAKVAEVQSAPQHRDRDYYLGALRDLDPSRDWSEAAPTKTAAQALVRTHTGQSGTRWSKEEIISHLTGQPVFGRTYLDTTKIDYALLLGVDPDDLNPVVDIDFLKEVFNQIGDDDVNRIYDHVALHHGLPRERTYSILVAALEELDPRGDFYGLPMMRILDLLREKGDPSRPEPPTLEERKFIDKETVLEVERQRQPSTLTNVQKRKILTGEKVHGLTLLPDLSVVWWGLFFPGFTEKPPKITPVVSSRTRSPDPEGRETYRSTLLYSNRHAHFESTWDIDLRERRRTDPWTITELTFVDYCLHLMPELAQHVDSVARYRSEDTRYDPFLRRLIVGSDASFAGILTALCRALALKILRVGYFTDRLHFVSPASRTPFLIDWLGIEPWRYKSDSRIYAPHTDKGQEAVLADQGEWLAPRNAVDERSPGQSIIGAIALYVAADSALPASTASLIRRAVFGGDQFSLEPVQVGAERIALPVRTRVGSRPSRA